MLAVLVALAAMGCGARRGETSTPTATPRATTGQPRAYRMGFSALPTTLTDQAQQDAFDLGAKYGDVLLLQKPVAWSEFAAGGTPSTKTRMQTASERDHAQARGLHLFIALDPFDPADRGRLASPPAGSETRDLSDPSLRSALVAQAKYVAINYKPTYLAIGVEVNGTYERNPTQYQKFVEAYREAYSAAKSASPNTMVFPTFEYEQLLGLVPWEAPHPPRWELLRDFGERSDMFAISTYPSFTYSVARKVPPDYYRQIKDQTKLPVAFASAGYASAPGRDGVNSSTPDEQRRFLQRLLGDADALASPLVIWFLRQDANHLTAPPFDLFQSIGLVDLKGINKQAWPIWESASMRPYDSSTPAKEPTPDPSSTP
ncbi:MAG: hypothetical protein DWI48_00975 [Chloroflexi bacterium]|nr:MAG: hypothetical protein DWI48_00975 [Chloroflexota bacterium]